MRLFNDQTRQAIMSQGREVTAEEGAKLGAEIYGEMFTLISRHTLDGVAVDEIAERMARNLAWCHQLYIEDGNANYIVRHAQNAIDLGYERSGVVCHMASLLVRALIEFDLEQK